jgi:uncharacterized protein YndB with AHSA1/START domain
MKQILHAVHIHATPSRVYRAITTGADLAGWWTTKVEIEERTGGLIRFTFAGDFHPHMLQTKLEPDRRVEWRCVAGHVNWQDNTFVFEMAERKGETLLLFSQHYAKELSDEVYGIYNFNWGYYLNSLKRLCETGAGTPFTPPPRT